MAETKLEMTAEELSDHFDYLDLVREIGATNMSGAGAYLQRDQGLDQNTARSVLSAWMKTFSTEPADERARTALLPTP